MELLTDILAIAGWALFGYWMPYTRLFDHKGKPLNRGLFISFGLIAASLVLG